MTEEQQKKTDVQAKAQKQEREEIEKIDENPTAAPVLKTEEHFKRMDRERGGHEPVKEGAKHPHPSTAPGPTVGEDAEESDKWTVGARVSTPGGGNVKLSDAVTAKDVEAAKKADAQAREFAERRAEDRKK